VKSGESIELDLHPTKDHKLVIIHDETVDRTTNGTGRVMDKTLAEIKELDAGSWFDVKYKDEKIPTFDELLALLNREKFQGILNIEIKTDHIEYLGIEEMIVEKIRDFNPWFKYLYSSFNERSLQRVHKLDPEPEKALIFASSEKQAKVALEAPYISAIHPKYTWMERHAKDIKNLPLKVRPWTIDDIGLLKTSFVSGVAGVITDFPQSAKNQLELFEGKKK
jgi:glycerophosphoryl diester phosphodiesterase